MEIKKDMYARTDSGIIAKITNVFDFGYKTYYLNFRNAAFNGGLKKVAGNKGKILKASFDITDLLKKGDIIKHCTISIKEIIDIDYKAKEIYFNNFSECAKFEHFKESFENGQLSILTKEKFYIESFKIGE